MGGAEEMTEEKHFDIEAFLVSQPNNLMYGSWLSEEETIKAVLDAIQKGAKVITIRLVEGDRPPARTFSGIVYGSAQEIREEKRRRLECLT